MVNEDGSYGENSGGSMFNIQPPMLREGETVKTRAFKLGSYLESCRRFYAESEKSDLWMYDSSKGIWVRNGNEYIQSFLTGYLGDSFSTNLIREVINHIRYSSYDESVILGGPPNKIVMFNGVYDLDSGQFVSTFNPNDYQITAIPVKYNPEADCPKFKKFCSEIFGTEVDQNAMEEVFGYCLYKYYSYALIVILLGGGSNGKSTLLNVLQSFLGGQNCSSCDPQQLEMDKFKLAELQGKLANIVGDIPAKPLEYTGILKKLTGNDPITAERKNRDPFQFRNHAKLIYSANKLPKAYDTTNAFHRRIRIIEFPFVFAAGDSNTIDQDKLINMLTTEEELSGIFNVAVEGWKRIRMKGQFTGDENVQEKRISYVKHSDPIEYMVLKFLYHDPMANPILKDVLYDSYTQLASALGHKPKNDVWFGRDLRSYLPFITSKQKTIDGQKVYAWFNLGMHEEEMWAEINGLGEVVEEKQDQLTKTKGVEDTTTKDMMSEKKTKPIKKKNDVSFDDVFDDIYEEE